MKKEPTAASFSAVAVNGGLQGGRRTWTGKEKRGIGAEGREIEEEGEDRWRREGAILMMMKVNIYIYMLGKITIYYPIIYS